MTVTVTGLSALDDLGKKIKKNMEKEVGKSKKKFASQAAQALVDILPVWSGGTQDSIVFSDGTRRVSGTKGIPAHVYLSTPGFSRSAGYITKDGDSTANAPLGQQEEKQARPSAILGQAGNAKNKLTDFYITANSYAQNAGLWRGLAPPPTKIKKRGFGGDVSGRNPQNTLAIVLSESIRGTIFKVTGG